MTTIVVIIVAYAVILVLGYLGQEKMIYFPTRYTRAVADERAGRLGLALWPADAEDYFGLVSAEHPGLVIDESTGLASSESPGHANGDRPCLASSDTLVRLRGVVLIFHGNAGSATDRFYYVPEIQRLGFRVVLCEYPGYGARPGSLREAALVVDAVQAARAAIEQFGEPLYVLGESLGCGVATALAARDDIDVRGVVLITPWDNLPNLAQALYPYVPARLLLRDRYDNIRNLRHYKGPIAVVMAGEDEIIPEKRTMHLFESLPENKRLWTLHGAGHNNWPAVVDVTWWREVMDFVSGGGGRDN
ncbi:MAG: alpha/beta fold hydrolase [bacterium]|nr:MAG: alpha/beta fold hydrolase [bacterium]